MLRVSVGVKRRLCVMILSVLPYLGVSCRYQDPGSPCPEVFRYQCDENVGLYGRIVITSPSSQIVQLNVEMSVGNRVIGYNGKIEVEENNFKEKLIDDVVHHRRLSYRVFFPVWQNIPPKITKILVNGNLICDGPKIPMHQARIVTTVNLQHTLRVQVQPLSVNGAPSDGNRLPHDDRGTSGDPQRRRFIFYPQGGGSDADDEEPVMVVQNPFNFKPKTKNPNRVVYVDRPYLGGNVPYTTSTTRRPTAAPSISPSPEDRPVMWDPQTLAQRTGAADGNDSVPFDDICGQAVTVNQLVFHGEHVTKGAYPWLAAVFWVNSSTVSYTVSYKCSASLISHHHVVTAAHCVRNRVQEYEEDVAPQHLLIKLGKLNIQEWVTNPGEKIVKPVAVYIHPDYKPQTSDADIAVLQLKEKIEFSTTIRPICLWREPTDLEGVVGDLGTVVGWGMDENGTITTASPRQIRFPVVSQEQCLRSSSYFVHLTSSRTFCAGFRNGSGPCNGDSGSGFILQRNGRWTLRGIVSISISEHATKRCDLSNYVIFTDASKHLNWLLSFIK